MRNSGYPNRSTTSGYQDNLPNPLTFLVRRKLSCRQAEPGDVPLLTRVRRLMRARAYAATYAEKPTSVGSQPIYATTATKAATGVIRPRWAISKSMTF